MSDQDAIPTTTEPEDATSAAAAEAEREPVAEAEAGLEAQAEPERIPETEPQWVIEPEPEAEPADEVEAPNEPALETGSGGEVDMLSVVGSEPEPAIEEVPEPAAEVEAEPDTAAVPEPPAAPAPRSVGRFIADALRSAGVRYAFTVPGESFLGLLDVLEDAGIRVVATRHEGAAAFMAEAHGQLTGRPAVCLGTRAVGASNLAIGIHTARQDSTPMFVVVGQVERDRQGREAFQEADIVASIGGLAKWAAEPRTADDVPSAIEEAVRQALGGRPGPVVLSMAEDLLDEPAPTDARVEPVRPAPGRPTDGEIREVIELLASARRPAILAGGGILRARTSTELARFADLLQVPVIAAWRRADVISNDDPLYLGMTGLGAAPSVRDRLEAADALVVIGCRLSEMASFDYAVPRPGQPWALVDIAPDPGDRPTPVVTVRADAKAFLKAANERLLGRAVLDAALVTARQANNVEDRAAFEATSAVGGGDWDGPGIDPGRTVATLRRILPDDAILTTDAGNFAGWAGRGFRFRRPGTFLGPTSGAMGYGLPAAISAALVHRDRPVVALVGDGGLGMTLAEVETAVRVGARVVVLCFDNERYGTIRMWQERRGVGVGVGTELGPVDFAAAGRALGARGVRVERDAEFEPALRSALAADRATVIHLVLDRVWLSVDQHP